jgi:lantibiotic transport system permease protein
MFAIIACTLMVQVEVKNNAWKQVFTTPVNYLSIYFSKFFVILLMIGIYFVSFTISMIATGYILSMVDPDFGAFKTSPDYANIVWQIGRIMFYLLPILSIHFWLSLRFKNPFMSIGTGLAMLILCIFLAAGKWDHTDAVPYTYTFWSGVHQKHDEVNSIFLDKTTFYCALWFLGIQVVSIFDFLRRRERG